MLLNRNTETTTNTRPVILDKAQQGLQNLGQSIRDRFTPATPDKELFNRQRTTIRRGDGLQPIGLETVENNSNLNILGNDVFNRKRNQVVEDIGGFFTGPGHRTTISDVGVIPGSAVDTFNDLAGTIGPNLKNAAIGAGALGTGALGAKYLYDRSRDTGEFTYMSSGTINF